MHNMSPNGNDFCMTGSARALDWLGRNLYPHSAGLVERTFKQTAYGDSMIRRTSLT